MAHSASGDMLATYGFNNKIELWSLPGMHRAQVLDTGSDVISRLVFINNSTDFVTASSTGQLIHWAADGTQRQKFELHQPIVALALASRTHAVMAATLDNALWLATTSQPEKLTSAHGRITCLATLPDQYSIAVGGSNVHTLPHSTVLLGAQAITGGGVMTLTV